MDTDIQVNSPSLIDSAARYRKAVIAAVAIAAFIGAIIGVSDEAAYTAKAHTVLADPADYLQFGPTTNVSNVEFDRVLETERRRAASMEVAEAAAARLGNDLTGADVRAATTVTRSETTLLTFSARSTSSAAALAVADALVTAYVDAKAGAVDDLNAVAFATFDDEITELRNYIDAITDETGVDTADSRATQQALSLLRVRRAEFLLDAAVIGDGVLLVEPATLAPSSSPLRIGAIGAVVGGLLGLIAATVGAWLMTTRHPRTRDQHEPAALLGAPLLGRVPAEARSNDAERLRAPAAFQLIASAVNARLESGVALIAGTGATSSSSVARNLGATFARDGRRVVIIDTHVDGVGVSGLLGPNDDSSGLAELLRSRMHPGGVPIDVGSAVHTVTMMDGAAFDVIPVGRVTDDLEYLMRTERLREIMAILRESYDLVLIDTAPLLERSIASSGSRHADAMVIVVAHNTELSVLEDVRHVASVMRSPVIGYVYCASDQTPLEIAPRPAWSGQRPSVIATSSV